MLSYMSIAEIVTKAETEKITIGQAVLAEQALTLDKSEEEILAIMARRLDVMRQAAKQGVKSDQLSASGLSGRDAKKIQTRVDQKKTILGPLLGRALARSLAVTEVNARMGRIVAAPTAGSCGILPAVLLTLAEDRQLSDEKLLPAMFTAAGFGLVIANKASISGASGGCQAECGSAAAMAAAAAVELLGGSPHQAAQACALALKSVLGLVCDPVAGLVEVPCIKRNASGTANALVATEMALAGIESVIPADEVIAAMKVIGDQMPAELKETALGGLAATKTARKIAADLL